MRKEIDRELLVRPDCLMFFCDALGTRIFAILDFRSSESAAARSWRGQSSKFSGVLGDR